MAKWKYHRIDVMESNGYHTAHVVTDQVPAPFYLVPVIEEAHKQLEDGTPLVDEVGGTVGPDAIVELTKGAKGYERTFKVYFKKEDDNG